MSKENGKDQRLTWAEAFAMRIVTMWIAWKEQSFIHKMVIIIVVIIGLAVIFGGPVDK